MRFLRKIENRTRRDRIRNKVIVNQLTPIEKLIEERQLSWLGHVHRMENERRTKRIFEARIQGRNKVGRPKKGGRNKSAMHQKKKRNTMG